MDYGDLKTELVARGFDQLTGTRPGQIINDAVAELDERYLWPYREASVTGTSPLAISDLGIIEQVINTSQSDLPLQPAAYQWLVATYGDLSAAGVPTFYYVAWPSGSPTVATYPSNSDTIGVQYWKTPALLSLDADEPEAPSRFHQVYLKIAQRMAESERGNLSEAQGLQAEIDRMIGRMVDALMGGQQVQGPSDDQRITFASEDW